MGDTRDPVWDPTNMGNPYTFVGNNPATNMDPTGEVAWVPVIMLGLYLGSEVAGWGASTYTGDPGLEVAPSQMLFHAATGSSIYGGSGGFATESYSGGERVYQGAVGLASVLGGGMAGAMARGASIPAWLLGADAALNVGIGAYDTSQGHTIMGPLQMALGAAGFAGLRGAGRAASELDTMPWSRTWLGQARRSAPMLNEAGEELYSPVKLKLLRGYLKRRGIRMVENADEFLERSRAHGAFEWDVDVPTLYLPSRPTANVVFHEMIHVRDFLREGREAYRGIGRLNREAHVLSALERARPSRGLSAEALAAQRRYVRRLSTGGY